MNAAMPAPERDKLAKLLALIGSDQVGERDNAISAASRLLERHRLRWSESYSYKLTWKSDHSKKHHIAILTVIRYVEEIGARFVRIVGSTPATSIHGRMLSFVMCLDVHQ
jgi:hypothetical protein